MGFGFGIEQRGLRGPRGTEGTKRERKKKGNRKVLKAKIPGQRNDWERCGARGENKSSKPKKKKKERGEINTEH